MSQSARGLVAMGLACVIWGLSPIFYHALRHVPPLEVLAHRTLWSFICFALILLVRGHGRAILECLRPPGRGVRTALAALVITCNWFGLIYAVATGDALQASLAYYIFPLCAVLLGFAVFGDRLRPMQWVAVTLATLAVTVLVAGLGIVPRLALMMALTFALYAAIKRGISDGAMATVAAETLVIAPVSLVWIAGAHLAGWTAVGGGTPGAFGSDWWTTALLIGSGPLTGLPIILFSYASQRATLSSIGLVQYLNPTLQFVCAVVIFGEAFTTWHAIAFALIWTGLALYSFDNIMAARQSARRRVA